MKRSSKELNVKETNDVKRPGSLLCTDENDRKWLNAEVDTLLVSTNNDDSFSSINGPFSRTLYKSSQWYSSDEECSGFEEEWNENLKAGSTEPDQNGTKKKSNEVKKVKKYRTWFFPSPQSGSSNESSISNVCRFFEADLPQQVSGSKANDSMTNLAWPKGEDLVKLEKKKSLIMKREAGDLQVIDIQNSSYELQSIGLNLSSHEATGMDLTEKDLSSKSRRIDYKNQSFPDELSIRSVIPQRTSHKRIKPRQQKLCSNVIYNHISRRKLNVSQNLGSPLRISKEVKLPGTKGSFFVTIDIETESDPSLPSKEK